MCLCVCACVQDNAFIMRETVVAVTVKTVVVAVIDRRKQGARLTTVGSLRTGK